MLHFSMPVQIRWSDLDPNFHLRHSVYYDWGAMCRVEMLRLVGMTGELMQRLQIGPIIFREECVFRREIHMNDKVEINLMITKAKKDFSRLTIRHEIIKSPDILAAVLTVEIAWMDTVKRKLANLPEEVVHKFEEFPRAPEFEWIGA